MICLLLMSGACERDGNMDDFELTDRKVYHHRVFHTFLEHNNQHNWHYHLKAQINVSINCPTKRFIFSCSGIITMLGYTNVTIAIIMLRIYMKQSLDSGWLRVVHFFEMQCQKSNSAPINFTRYTTRLDKKYKTTQR